MKQNGTGLLDDIDNNQSKTKPLSLGKITLNLRPQSSDRRRELGMDFTDFGESSFFNFTSSSRHVALATSSPILSSDPIKSKSQEVDPNLSAFSPITKDVSATTSTLSTAFTITSHEGDDEWDAHTDDDECDNDLQIAHSRSGKARALVALSQVSNSVSKGLGTLFTSIVGRPTSKATKAIRQLKQEEDDVNEELMF